MKWSICFTLLLVFFSCRQSEMADGNPQNSSEVVFSNTFELYTYDGFSIAVITKPWQKANNEKIQYILAEQNTDLPDSLSGNIVIRTPVKSVVCLSTTHIGFISALKKTATIKGISGKDYFYDSLLREDFNQGFVRDVGYPPSLDYEAILKIKPDVVFLYGLESSVTGIIKRLSDAGIVAVIVSDFLEQHPLGKTEWIKFFARFYGLKLTGDSIFSVIHDNYLRLSGSVMNTLQKPKVLTGLPWKDTWYVAGGRSLTSRFIEDAGGDYLWKDDLSDEYIPLSLEYVYNTSAEADIWINCGTSGSLEDLLSRDRRFGGIKALGLGMVYNNNARSNHAGGNDFWESGALRSDLILKDMISFFHPGIIAEHELFYYRKLK